MNYMPKEEEIKKIIDEEKFLAEYSGDDKVISSLEMEKIIAEQKDVFRFSSPFPSLDQLTQGFECGECVIISSFPKHGKTSLCLDFLQHFEEQDIQCLFFSFEMPPRQLFLKFQELPLFYLPQQLKDKDLDWIEKRIMEAKIKYNVKVVFIDHLGFIFDLARAKNISIELGYVVRRLKSIARDNDLIFFLIHHCIKEQMDKTPSVADLRDSGLVAAEADSTIMLWRQKDKVSKEFTNQTMLSVENHRRTGVMKKRIKLIFDEFTHRFKEYGEDATL